MGNQNDIKPTEVSWLLDAMQRMLRCRTVGTLLEVAYDAIRNGLGFDRVGLLTVDHGQRALIERLGTDERGQKFFPRDRVYAFESGAYLISFLIDPRMATDGPGYILQASVSTEIPPEGKETLDGTPQEVLRVIIRSGDMVWGLISVDNLVSSRKIDDSDISPLVIFAGALGLAIENVSLLEQRAIRIHALDADVRKHATEVELLREVARRVNEAILLDEVLDVVYDAVRYGLGYDRVGIVLMDRERELFEERRGTDAEGNKTIPTDRILPLDTSSEIWEAPDMVALQAGAEYFYTSDITANTPEDQRYLLDGQPRENLNVPLRSGSKLTGQISVDNLLTGRHFGEEDAPPLVALANLVGPALEKARLLERERVERLRLQVLLESAHALSSTLDSSRILTELASRLVSALGATTVYFTDVDRATRTLRSLAVRTGGSAAVILEDPERAVREHFDVIEEVLEGRKPHVGRATSESRPSGSAFLNAHHLDAELIVPLIVQGTPVGVLELYWATPTPVLSDTIDLCMAIAQQASVALGNAGQYAQAALQAERDPLTGLLNHRALLEHLDRSLLSGEPFALLMVDVDDFKNVNDAHGHLAGDGVLTSISATLQAACREVDRAARYGGDEFAIVLHGIEPEKAAAVWQRLDGSVRDTPYQTENGTKLSLSVSIGMAAHPEDGNSRQALIEAADARMYAMKRSSFPTHATE